MVKLSDRNSHQGVAKQVHASHRCKHEGKIERKKARKAKRARLAAEAAEAQDERGSSLACPQLLGCAFLKLLALLMFRIRLHNAAGYLIKTETGTDKIQTRQSCHNFASFSPISPAGPLQLVAKLASSQASHMEDWEAEALKLPLVERCTHTNWKARSAAYDEILAACNGKPDDAKMAELGGCSTAAALCSRQHDSMVCYVCCCLCCLH